MQADRTKKLFVEVANSPTQRECGLMNRKYLPQNQGMLFKFHRPVLASFWMKDTYIPLDIAFLDDSGKILQIESLTPLNTKATYSNYPCKYALEVNRGWFSKNNITVGSRIDGEGISSYKKIAQIMLASPLSSTGAAPGDLEAIPGQPPGDSAQPPQPNPDVTLDMTYKERLKKAELKGQKLLIVYQTKGGLTLPPKVISPPFRFEKDEDDNHDAVVKAWDEQTGGWKSFLIDNILSLEEKK